VSIIIAAHNEEKRIDEKLDNTLDLKYPKDKLQIIVVSDGSTDNTEEIVKKYENKGVELVIAPRKGKENAQNQALKESIGEIIVFTDVATKIDTKGITEIVGNFEDPKVGCVSSEDLLIDDCGIVACGEALYVRYEMWLRRLESKAYSLVGLSGSFFAVRKELCSNFKSGLDSDFQLLVNCVKVGMKGVSDKKAIGYYKNISCEEKEFIRKQRTIIRGIALYFKNLDLLNYKKYGFFSYQYFCHKLLRWLVPFFLILAFISNFILLTQSIVYTITFMMQLSMYVMSILGYVSEKYRSMIVVRLSYYFVSVNYAILTAWLKYARGQRITMWDPSQR
jgi:cellulose synthase/poly-beta-1,6-N-acetylglucosamine synthase-like glycosyltransferase